MGKLKILIRVFVFYLLFLVVWLIFGVCFDRGGSSPSFISFDISDIAETNYDFLDMKDILIDGGAVSITEAELIFIPESSLSKTQKNTSSIIFDLGGDEFCPLL